ncbi:cytochrome P450 [Lentzea sp. NBRC 105346]|uniref:cytochrome P450 n=1 Tax=Lentzea sp. NBRC 105346 TaxID=3032205 RepID=UPI0024A4C285|nr:cytochrome P450 [Lentzea sp. NBRC 105346]GLZ32395.1 cytochrome P450 [Lentzea sp. NBRC 105346]
MTFTYEPFTPSFDRDPHPTYRHLREHAPVYFWEPAGVYLVSRYADVEALLKDRRFALPGMDSGPPRTEGGRIHRALFEHAFFGLPKGDHARVRKLVTPAFAPREAARRHDAICALVGSLIDSWGDQSEVDIVSDFARPIPVRVMSHLLGIPAEHDALFGRFAQAMIMSVLPWIGPDEFDREVEIFPAAAGMLGSLIEQRRAAPGDDLLSLFVGMAGLSVEELLGVVASLVVGGAETSVHLIANGVRTLLAHPDALALVRADPSLLPGALAEASRFDSFAKHGLSRTALEDVELHGVTVPAGSRLVMLMASALRDPAVFDDPDRFDLHRPPTRLMFGAGSHFCLGHALARAEAEAAIGLLLRRFPALRPAAEPEFAPNVIRRELSSLRVWLR